MIIQSKYELHKVYIIWMLTFKTIVSRFEVYTVFSTKIVTTSEFNHPIRSMSYDHLQSVINSYYWHKHKGNGITSTAHTHICRLCSLLQGPQFGFRFCVLNCKYQIETISWQQSLYIVMIVVIFYHLSYMR